MAASGGFFDSTKRNTLFKPGMLPIQIVASFMWPKMLVMGVMVVFIGFALAIFNSTVASNAFDPTDPNFNDRQTFEVLRRVVPGVIFLGMGFLFSGITFALGTILGTLRQGGGEVQVTLGRKPQALQMPWPIWFGVPSMIGGLIILISNFVLLSIVLANKADNAFSGFTGQVAAERINDFASLQSWETWVDPLRFVGVAVMLVGITMFLYAIIIVLRFQMTRVREMAAGQD